MTRKRGTHRPGAGNATLSDVAAAAGVSTATVSRCLNTPDLVQQTTRDRVQDAVRRLSYAPNFGARALAARQTDTIGAIVPTLDNAIFARGLQAFQEELGTAGVTLLVASSLYRADLEDAQVRTLVARGADALLLIGYDRDPAVHDFLDRRKVPHVVSWAHDPDRAVPSVGFDNRAAMCSLAEQVLALGHRRFGLITAQRIGNDRARGRWLGVLDALHGAGLDESALTVHETTYSYENGQAGLRDILSSGNPPTVVMCGNDVLAAGALQEAREMGLSVPRDVSITGFDDIEIAKITHPRLTTVHVPHREMGRRAARMLLSLREAPDAPGSCRLDTGIRMRETLAAPRIALTPP